MDRVVLEMLFLNGVVEILRDYLELSSLAITVDEDVSVPNEESWNRQSFHIIFISSTKLVLTAY